MNEIERLVRNIENYNEHDLCLGTLRTLKRIKEVARTLEENLTQVREENARLTTMLDLLGGDN
jgi:cell shape-determining protein MreC